MVTDAAEGPADSSHMSTYLCIYVFMQGHTAAADPSDSTTLTRPAGGLRPAKALQSEMTS